MARYTYEGEDALWVRALGEKPSFGSPPDRRLEPKEVCLEVIACGLNHADLLMMNGRYQENPNLPFIPGMEICGRVISLGQEAARRFGIGDLVAGYIGCGGLSSQTICTSEALVLVPEDLDPVIAAAIPITYGTAELALKRIARINYGETLLILGAAGGTGFAALQMGLHYGAKVIAVAHGKERQQMLHQAGAMRIFSPSDPDLAQLLREAGPADIVFDTVGGNASQASFRAINPEARFLLIGFASGEIPKIALNHALVKNAHLFGINWPGYRKFNLEAMRSSIEKILKLASRKAISPVITTFQFPDVLDAFELLRERKTTGKLVITFRA